MNTEKFWVLAFIAATILWGWSFSAIHETLHTLSAPAFNAYRFLMGAGVVAIVLMRRLHGISRVEWRDGGLAGLVLFLAFAFQTLGIGYTTASNASFITGLAVVFTPVCARTLLKEHPNRQQIIGAIAAAIGLGFLTIHDFSVHLGDALLLCAVFFALHIVLLSKTSKIRDVATLAFIQMLVVGLLSLVWAYASRQFTMPRTDQAVSTILIMGVFGTALAYFVQTKAQVLTSPNKIAMILVLEPVFGGFFGYWLAGDRLTPWKLFGAALIVLAMIVTEAKLVTRPQMAKPVPG